MILGINIIYIEYKYTHNIFYGNIHALIISLYYVISLYRVIPLSELRQVLSHLILDRDNFTKNILEL